MRNELIAAFSHDHGVHAYSKWQGAHWRLAALVELGVPAGHPGAVAAAEQTLTWLADPERLRQIHKRRIDGRVRRCASQDGLAIYGSCKIGLRDDPRLAVLAESLVETQWPDGGWNCDRKPKASHSSFNESWAPVLGLAAYGETEAAERGAEFLLRHRIVFSERTGQLAHPRLTTLRYPPYWHYDLLVGLTAVARSIGLADDRNNDALDLLESKRRADGTWRSEGKWWKRPGSKGSNVEGVDWGGAANELLTERALEVLGAAGRV